MQLEISPESFLTEVAFARTFIPEAEVDVMRSQGFGHRASHGNILILEPARACERISQGT